jgi:DNA repair protein RecN (Recombination protein N)
MLTHLHLKDLVIVDRAELELQAGMTALTGETGAGKSIIV